VLAAAALLALAASGVVGDQNPALIWLGLTALALGVAPSLDDPAAAVTASLPVGRRRRTLQRLVVPVAVLAAWCGYAASVGGHDGLASSSLAWTGVGVLLAVVASDAVLRRAGTDEPGPAVGAVALLVIVTCVLLQPFGDVVVLQAYPERGALPQLWPVVVVAAVALLWWTSADPAGRRPGGAAG
jgi:hypothetical protein